MAGVRRKTRESVNGWAASGAGRAHLRCASLAIAAIIASAAVADPAQARWINIGPYGGSVWTLAIDSRGTVYSGVSGRGVFRRARGAVTWASANRGIETQVVVSVAIDPLAPTTLYAGTYEGIFKTTDGGNSWLHVHGLSEPFVRSLAIDPISPSILYAATAGGVFKSSDAGKDWRNLSRGLSTKNVNAIAIDPLLPSTLYAGTNGDGVFKSTDGAANWLSATTGLPPALVVNSLAVDPTSPAVLYLVGGGTLFKSEDAGASWSESRHGLEAVFVYTILVPGGPILYAATDRGVFRSGDGGASWQEANTGLGESASGVPIVLSLASDPASPALYAGSLDEGVFQSINAAESWSQFNAGLATLSISAIAVGARAPALYAASDEGLHRSTDGGASWKRVLGGVVNVLAVDPISSSNLYAGGNTGIYRSTDAGHTWSQVGLGYSNDVRALAVSPSSPTTLYSGTVPVPTIACRFTSACGGAYRSDDGGSTWTSVSDGLPEPWSGLLPNLFVSAIAVDPTSPSTVYVATSGHLAKSTDAGSSWTELSYASSSAWIAAILVDPSSSARVYLATAGSGVFRSTDGGATWAQANVGLTSLFVNALAIDPFLPTTLYAGTDVGLLVSTDAGTTWLSVESALPVRAIAVRPDGLAIYAGTPEGVYQVAVRPSRTGPRPQPRIVSPRP